MRQSLLLAAAIALCCTGASAEPNDPQARAAAVEAQMTDDERFQLLHGVMPFAIPGLPAPPPGLTPTAGYIAGVARLGVPDIYETDASLGVTNPLQLRPGDTATALPSGQASASTWNPSLAFAAGAMVAREARARGFNVLLGPGLNLARNPRNGRNFEYLGEDPLLAGVLAGEFVRGVQSEHVIATVKHFALNNDETLRLSLDVAVGEGAARESDLLAFQIAIERGEPGAVMCAYNLVNGAKACGNDWLLNRVLKQDWGYRGWVMSDWGAVDDVSYFNAGLDQQSGAQLDRLVWFDAPLRAEAEAGHVSRERVSDAVRRILYGLYAAGADAPGPRPAIDQGAHGAIARAVAGEGIVLLKNEGAVLPLTGEAKRILVVGGYADIGVMSGGGSSQVSPAGGAAAMRHVGGRGFMAAFGRQLIVPSSPLAALRAALPEASIEFESGYWPEMAAARARRADIAIVFATQWQIEGFDAGSMRLPEGQDELIGAVAAANPNTIVVLETGNPVEAPWADSVKAILAAWYPGQEGGAAIADVLTGAVNPSGRLPQSWPFDATQNPRPLTQGLDLDDGARVTLRYDEGSDIGYRWFARREGQPRYAFGHGLSYTSFAYGNLRVRGGDTISATFTVTNTGARRGATTTQLYLTEAPGASLLRLIAFAKVELGPGERRTVRLEADPRLLASFADGAWRIDEGRYHVALANSAADLVLRGAARLSARAISP